MPIAPPFSLPALTALQSHWRTRSSFTFLDLDFDEGRRLLALAAAFLGDPQAPHCLHYFAVAEDLDGAALAMHAAAMPAADPVTPFSLLVSQLARAWMPSVPGFQRLILAQGRVVLTLVGGTPAADMPQLDLAFDAAYCRQADAAPDTIRWLGRLAAADALMALGGPAVDAATMASMVTMVTVRADFLRAGFADADGDIEIYPMRFTRKAASHALPRHLVFRLQAQSERHAIVIGAGLAGAAACHRLAARGWRCTLIERHAAAAQEASGNAAGIFMPVLSQDDNPLSRLSRAAFLFALHIWDGLGGVGAALPGQACGVLQLPRSDALAAAGKTARASWPEDFARCMNDAEATAAFGQRVGGGWWFGKGGWLRPAAVCEAMLRACGDRLHVLYQRQALRLLREDGAWRALDAAGAVIAQAPVLILANGMQATAFAQVAHLPLSAIRGQVTYLPAQAADVPFVVCGDAYLTPVAANGIASLGATYDQDADPALRLESQRQNIGHLRQMLPDWTPPDSALLDGRVGFRCVSADRLPLAGALPDPAQLRGSGDTRLEQMPRLAGLHGLLGYGSRGLIWAPLMAELLASQLDGEPSPLPRDLAALLDPARFALRQRRRTLE
ncbi:MAG TPA: FAD-dependent 5-carboxymethylaminomethyl-2-thiouridine(34) oxidoreductase MnmC [Herbaspirillum sp.]|jgi:tRNA 5-methylaminomethyl-2-thiouridine biosynthesis bifunctional protein